MVHTTVKRLAGAGRLFRKAAVWGEFFRVMFGRVLSVVVLLSRARLEFVVRTQTRLGQKMVDEGLI